MQFLAQMQVSVDLFTNRHFSFLFTVHLTGGVAQKTVYRLKIPNLSFKNSIRGRERELRRLISSFFSQNIQISFLHFGGSVFHKDEPALFIYGVVII